MRRILAVLSLTFFAGLMESIAFAQMGGMGPGNMGPGGQQVPTNYASNGERIYFTGFNDAGERIRFSGGPAWLWVHGGGCADCHGVDGQGGFPVMMGTQIPPNITYQALIEGEHEHGGAEADEDHQPYTDELIRRAITEGLDPSDEPLDLTMPRWQMSEADLNDLIDYLKTLSSEEPTGEPVTIERAQSVAQGYLSSLNFPDLMLDELIEYRQGFIAKFKEQSTGRYAFDVLIDRQDGQIYPAMGPMMGWNTKYNGTSMMGGRFGMMGNVFNDLRFNFNDAQRLARQFIAQNNLNATLADDHVHTYYGFYEFHVEQDGQPTYFIAVNGYTGQVVYETWLGPMMRQAHFSDSTTGERTQIVLKPTQEIVRQGGVFSVEIIAGQLDSLSGYQVEVRFDPSILQVQDVTEGPFLKGDGAEVFWKSPVIDNLNGHIRVVAARIARGGVSGTGTLATIAFEAAKAGETPLTVADVILSDPAGQVLEASVSGASITVQDAETSWDANGDGRVDIVDLVLVGSHFGESVPADASPNPDVNRDGQVNVVDLVLVGGHFGEGVPAGPASLISVRHDGWIDFSEARLHPLRHALDALEALPNPSQGAITARDFLRAWLAQVKPGLSETRLFQNFPNPFNPETWMPYQLHKAGDVTIRIYTARGQLIRTLSIGHKPAGIYTTQQTAAYWDGRDETGQQVSSGVYFYRLDTGEVSQTKKMIVQK